MYILYISRVISLLYKRLPYVALNTNSFGTVIISIVSYKSFGDRLNSRLPELLTVIDQKLFTLFQVYYILQVCWSVPACSIQSECAGVSLLAGELRNRIFVRRIRPDKR